MNTINQDLENAESEGSVLKNERIAGVDFCKDAELISLKKELEEARGILEESRNLLKKSFFDFDTLFKNSSQAYLLVDRDYKIINFNATANRNCLLLLNKSLENNIAITTYLPPDDYFKFFQLLKEAFEGKSINSEFYVNDIRGEKLWFHINISPVNTEEDAAKFVLIVFNNISEHANRSIAVLESVTDGMFALNENWEFTYVNAKAEKMIKKKRAELIGKNIWEEFKLKSNSVFFRKYKQAVEERKDIHFEEYSFFMGGWIEVHAYPSKEGISVYFRSINERKLAEEKQRESEEWFKAVLATSRDGFAVEVEERLIYMNNAFLDLFGYSSQDAHLLTNMDVRQLYAEESKNAIEELKNKRERGEDVPAIYECKGKKKDGTVIDLEISTSLLHMKNKNFLIVLARDITNRKKAEVQLIDQNAELLKINSELDKFVYSASHDLRAPLMSILGLINIAKIETKEDQNLEYLDLMTKSIHKLDKFVQDIINYSRNSRLSLQNEPIDFKVLLKENLDEIKYLEHAELIEIIITLDQKIIFASDKSRISVLLKNIISNAIKYYNAKQPHSYIKIGISVSKQNARIEIEDNGIGISSQHIDKIFDMFYRASETNVGSGLGLYIVKETVSKLNGDIEVLSTFGEGTKFIITVPNLLTQQLLKLT